MSLSSLAQTRTGVPLRALALTVEESAPGDFHWCIVESAGTGAFSALLRSEMSFAAYDTALATGYGELQRMIGPDLQYGPRVDGSSSRNGAVRARRLAGVAAPSPMAMDAPPQVMAGHKRVVQLPLNRPRFRVMS